MLISLTLGDENNSTFLRETEEELLFNSLLFI
jgi:hypothetical protein